MWSDLGLALLHSLLLLIFGVAAYQDSLRREWLSFICNALLVAGFTLALTALAIQHLGPRSPLSPWQSLLTCLYLWGASVTVVVLSGFVSAGGWLWRRRRRRALVPLPEQSTPKDGVWPPPPSNGAT